MGAVLAKVFTIRIHRGSLGTNRRLATPVRPAGPTIACGARESVQCAEVAQVAAAIPKKSVLGAPASQVRGSGHPACIVHLKSRAIRPGPAYRAEVGDGIAWRLCYGKRGEQAARANQSQDRLHVKPLHSKEAQNPPRADHARRYN